MATTDNDAGRLNCFVIGPIGNRHAELGSEERRVYEEALEVYEEVILGACKEVGLTPVRADGLGRAGEIPEQVFRRLRDDDVVIADVTAANANVMYELGLRHTKGLLTLQVGEYGRLPFDVNVIRTVMFSRSPNGLVSARKELRELLEAGLAGDFDPVTATQVWNEGPSGGSEVPVRPTDDTPTDGGDADHEDDEPGFLDIMAAAEDAYGDLGATTEAVNAASMKLNSLTDEMAQQIATSDAQGLGMKGRLAVAGRYADGLDKIADELEQNIDAFERAFETSSAGWLAIVGQLEENPDQISQVGEFGMSGRWLAATTRETLGSLAGLISALRENARLSRVLRPATNRVTAAFDRFARRSQAWTIWIADFRV